MIHVIHMALLAGCGGGGTAPPARAAARAVAAAILPAGSTEPAPAAE